MFTWISLYFLLFDLIVLDLKLNGAHHILCCVLKWPCCCMCIVYHCLVLCDELSLGLGLWIWFKWFHGIWHGMVYSCEVVNFWSCLWIIGTGCAVTGICGDIWSGPDNHKVHCSAWLGRVTLVLVHDVFAFMTKTLTHHTHYIFTTSHSNINIASHCHFMRVLYFISGDFFFEYACNLSLTLMVGFSEI